MKNNLFVIFGATGNLTYKKLLPALYRLMDQNLISSATKIICIGRKNFTTKSYIEDALTQVKEEINWSVFKKSLFYYQMDIESMPDYIALKTFIENNCQMYTDNSIFYLATAPGLFPIIARGISEGNLVSKEDLKGRVVFEKPFGEDLDSAKKYNQMVRDYFDENQIYRIDHYLGKEMIQNILVVRFSNKIFEDIWNNKGIKSVTILAKETGGVMNRGGYYDGSGALKDMVQNHLMQMLSLIAMEPPEDFDTDDIRQRKVQVIQKLKANFNAENLLVGQYKGYKKEKGVDPDSKTETFVFLKAEIDTERWKGVPFYILTGKQLDEKKSEIIIEFLENSHSHKKWPKDSIQSNRLIIRVDPEDGITFQINTKIPGLSSDVKPVVLDYCHGCQAIGNLPEAYEKLLLDIVLGDTTLFPRWDEIEHSWQFIDQVKAYLGDTTPIEYTNFEELRKKVIK
ncbi:glucose-6-phosphate 1-dehydrogenase [Alkaliphilus metalliredigens QYMF]|uniref:Glucose-6-phosphate 1-dehydrogenase n=1 Tax=Alkaliphilus metalliredigens (strain QYMF) TaxID=293826 RepID=A6TTS8_ALKMQ|nr:glucose-6-phosphate dehydrogenase [Alkaliphilus metalliredigens]ABR49596.1 glucose-6-phosphate 1-dehydrogenase [Alkaliphilus metalliredigens QYMF]